jgi:hypothetical protein
MRRPTTSGAQALVLRRARGREVAQPAEPVELALPGRALACAWGRQVEGRGAVERHGKAGEADAAGGDLVGEARVHGAQVGRRQHQLADDRGAMAPAHQARAAHAGKRTAAQPVCGEHGKADAVARRIERARTAGEGGRARTRGRFPGAAQR